MSHRIAVIAPTYADARIFADERRKVSGGARCSLITPTTHPGAIAGIVFDEVVRIDGARGSDRLEEILRRKA